MKKKLTCVIKNFGLQDDDFHYYSPPFKVADCDWRLIAFPKRDTDGGYLSMYLDLAPESLPPGWRRDVKVSLTLVKKGLAPQSLNQTLVGKGCFDAENNRWGFEEFLPLSKLWRYLDDYKLTIIAELDVIPDIVLPEEPEIQPVKETIDVNGFEVLSSASALEEQNVSIFINTQKSLGGNYTSRGLGRYLEASENQMTCLVAFPKGNNGDYLSLYLDVADFETLPCGWRRYVKLRLTVVNQLSPKLSVVKGDSPALMESRQLGVPAMLPLFKLHENDGGFLVKGQVMIVAELDVFEVIGTFDDVVAAESSDLLKKTSLGINANGTKPVLMPMGQNRTVLRSLKTDV
ncbi:unnamed protein product [Brassica rapa]|uniref:MATH domain-containing protein n=1 Tax=Brassica campestris TaxID=3711 RepID=A0A8D9HSJ3_BRACM|nr:unnamed protein product [Brassica rapa]